MYILTYLSFLVISHCVCYTSQNHLSIKILCNVSNTVIFCFRCWYYQKKPTRCGQKNIKSCIVLQLKVCKSDLEYQVTLSFCCMCYKQSDVIPPQTRLLNYLFVAVTYRRTPGPRDGTVWVTSVTERTCDQRPVAYCGSAWC